MISNGCIRLPFGPEFIWQQKYFLLQVAILGWFTFLGALYNYVAMTTQ